MQLSNLPIGRKIGLTCSALVLLGVMASGVGIYFMNRIGGEIAEIAEEDIPLTEALTDITLHQLEQGILLERGLRQAIQGGTNQADATAKAFVDMGHKVDEEIVGLEKTLTKFIKTAHSEATKKEFTNLLAVIKKIDADHAAYEARGHKLLETVKSGMTDNLGKEIEAIEEQGDAVDHALEDALKLISTFTEKSAKQAEADEQLGIAVMVGALALLIALGVTMTVLVSRAITRPIIDLKRVMEVMDDGERQVTVPGTDNGDETGSMARAVEKFRIGLIEADRLAEVQRQAELATIKRAELIEQLNAEFERSAGAILDAVGNASEELRVTSQSMASIAEETESQATAVASASEQASSNVQTVAAASEELSSSVREISSQVNHAAERVREAASLVESADTQVAGLSNAANKIGEVVQLINDVAEQTNLLALNATIEAARAGEAGKGFAVVASEVKNLANQTQRATYEIGQQIKTVQEETGVAVTAIHDIGKAISQINEVSQSIASAVEEQNAATSEITRNVDQAAEGTQEVSANIRMVSDAAGETGSASNQVKIAAEGLTTKSLDLREIVSKYLADVKAA